MGYMHIDNLYKNQDILLFKSCYALEKIHGTSAHVSCEKDTLRFFAGGYSHQEFMELFDQDALLEKLKSLDVVIYGECYGGTIQKMSHIYGKEVKFVAFDVKISGLWLSVPQAESFCSEIGIEFVDYVFIPTEITQINQQRDKHSTQAMRNGMDFGCMREGVVLRPPIEVTKNNGARIMAKHKNDSFKETRTPRKIHPEKLKVLEDARAIAREWVTPMRITHVLDKINEPCMEKMREIILAMQEDIKREGEGEIVWNKETKAVIGKATAVGVKEYFQNRLTKK